MIRGSSADPFFVVAGEIIRTPFSVAQLPKWYAKARQVRKDLTQIFSLLIEAKQRPYATLLKERVSLLPPESAAHYTPLIGLSALAANKTMTATEQAAIYRGLFQMVLTKGSLFSICDILQDPLPAETRSEVVKWMFYQLGQYRDFSCLSQETHKAGLRQLYSLWKRYPAQTSEKFPSCPYMQCLLQLYLQGVLDTGALEPFTGLFRNYASQYQVEKCPLGYFEGWSARLLALREAATVYMIGLDLKLWQGKKEIDSVFPGYSTSLKEAAFVYLHQSQGRYAEAEICFLGRFILFDQAQEEDLDLLPSAVLEVKLILETTVELHKKVASFEVLSLFLMQMDGLLQEWRQRPEMLQLVRAVSGLMEANGYKAGVGCLPFLRRFFGKEQQGEDVATIFVLLLRHFESQLNQLLNLNEKLPERMIQAAIGALPHLKRRNPAYLLRLREIFPENLPSYAHFAEKVSQTRTASQKLKFVSLVNFLVSPKRKEGN